MQRETIKEQDELQERLISIHSLHAEGDMNSKGLQRLMIISIHSLHAEGDEVTNYLDSSLLISIHSLHAEGDYD